VTTKPKPPLTNAELQRAFRARQKESGKTEVRGIFAPPTLHERIKLYASRLVARYSKTK
jgi:hypothetical protein